MIERKQLKLTHETDLLKTGIPKRISTFENLYRKKLGFNIWRYVYT